MNRESRQREAVKLTVYEAILAKLVGKLATEFEDFDPSSGREAALTGYEDLRVGTNQFRRGLALYRGSVTENLQDANDLAEIIEQEWEKTADAFLDEVEQIREAVKR